MFLMKNLKITVNGVVYDVQVEETDGSAAPAAAAAPSPVIKAAPKPAPVQAAGGEEVKSPMPGTILNVPVKAGQAVKKGDVLVVLEAMKMENDIVAPEDGTVLAVNTTKGSSVNPGDALAVLG